MLRHTASKVKPSDVAATLLKDLRSAAAFYSLQYVNGKEQMKLATQHDILARNFWGDDNI